MTRSISRTHDAGYWNLEGHSSGSCLSHVLKLHASHITPTDETLIPTGKLQPVKSTPYDFTIARPLSATSVFLA